MPLYSTVSLVAEIIISSVIFYVFWSGYKKGKFPNKLAAAALTYEILFNISYMIVRVPNHTNELEIPWHIALAAFHGILSLVMFACLVAFFILAFLNYKKGQNYFRDHKYFTWVFLLFWTTSVVSGVVFYFVEYFT